DRTARGDHEMACQDWAPTGRVEPREPQDRAAADGKLDLMLAALEHAPHAFDFFDVLRRFECAHPGRARLGRGARPCDEPVRLGQEPSLGFAPSTLASLAPPTDHRPARLAVHFLGLLGPNGPLPLHLTEYARDRSRNAGDATLVRFLDIFHHRILSLFYRAWADSQPTVSFDRPTQDRFTTYLGSLFGLGMPSLRDRDDYPDRCKLFFAGRLATEPRNAEGLRAMLGAFFGLPVKIEEFVGEWLPLPEQARWRLGRSLQAGVLGQSTVAGARTWQRQSKFRIVFGPLEEGDFESFLPGSPRLRRLVALVRTYVGDSLNWDVRLELIHRVSRPLRLGRVSRLGWGAWLGHCPDGVRRQDIVLQPLHCMNRSPI
ncbi:MAG TPA: type VI secretion system baseplate subunit TssG, partial [Polyangia bacterium]